MITYLDKITGAEWVARSMHLDLLDWKERDAASAPGAAFDLLASWGQVQRFSPEELSRVKILPELRQVMVSDAHILLKAALLEILPWRWEESLARHAKLWEGAETSEDEAELAEAGLQVFTELDNMGLAAWTALQLAPDSAAWKEVQGKVAHCRALFAAEAWRFDSVGRYVDRIRAEWRSDLLAFDPSLAEVSCIYVMVLGAMHDAGLR